LRIAIKVLIRLLLSRLLPLGGRCVVFALFINHYRLRADLIIKSVSSTNNGCCAHRCVILLILASFEGTLIIPGLLYLHCKDFITCTMILITMEDHALSRSGSRGITDISPKRARLIKMPNYEEYCKRHR
jgi:hypothetical protein